MYSQWGQDKWVLSYFKKGTFVDVGFNDGVVISSTKLLDDLGWSGIGIDPFPRNYENRKNTIVEIGCVYREKTTVQFTKASDLGGISEHIEAHKNHEWVINADKTIIEANTLEYFLKKHNMPQKIEYLSIDTEGSEYEILSTFPFDKWTFGCLSYEHNGEWDKREKVNNLLKEKNYIFDRELGTDDGFIHESVKLKTF